VSCAQILSWECQIFECQKIVESTDTCVSARHIANMLADMAATRPKTVLAEVLTMSRRHVAYGFVGNMSVGNLLTKILFLHVFNVSMPLCHYASTPVRQYASRCAPVDVRQ
jgi:hypothetical protein